MFRKFIRSALGAALLFCLFNAPAFSAVRIENLVNLEGTGSNKLIGFGVVVGLNQTGDRQRGITNATIANLLKNLGNLAVDPTLVQTEDTAAVVVTVDLGSYAKPGDSVDAVVSAMGDASSLQGGTLLLTPLRGADGKVYGMAQGPLSVGGFSADVTGNQLNRNYALAGRVPNGALITQAPDSNMLAMTALSLVLRHPDFGTATQIVEAINDRFGNIAEATDAAEVQVQIPDQFKGHPVEFMAAVGDIEVVPDQVAKVVINERTGTVVMGGDVTLSPVAVAHGNLTIIVRTKPVFPRAPVVQVGPPGQAVNQTQITANEQQRRLMYLGNSATLRDVVDALDTLGVSPRDLISIVQALKESGSLHAELEIL